MWCLCSNLLKKKINSLWGQEAQKDTQMETWGTPCEDTHRKIWEEACGRGYCWADGRKHSWKEDLHTGGGMLLRDCDRGQPVSGQQHPQGLWLWVTHTGTGTPCRTAVHRGSHARADKTSKKGSTGE